MRILCLAESTVDVILTGDDVVFCFDFVDVLPWCGYVGCFYVIHYCEDIVGIC